MGVPDRPANSKPAADSPIPASSSQSPQANVTQSGTDDGKKGFHLWVDTLSKIALMIGAVLGGLWALKGYMETTAPTLETKTHINSHLEWPDNLQTPETCWAEYDVSLKNDGTTPFTIHTHKVTVWLLDGNRIPTPIKEPIPFMPLLNDSEKVYREKPTPPIDEDIQQHYPPGIESSSAGVLIFKRPTKGTFVVVMRIDVHGYTNSTFRRRSPCGRPFLDLRQALSEKPCP